MTGRFDSDRYDFFRAVYNVGAPWDIGAPQPDMVALLNEYPPSDPVLDIGCGSGDLAIHLAGVGHQTMGVDFIETAIDQANRKRASLPADIQQRLTFRVGNAARPTTLNRQFGAVVDSGFLHLLDAGESFALVAELSAALGSGGRYYLHEFAIEFPVPDTPRAVNEAELRTAFDPAHGWRILDIRSGNFHNTVAEPVPAILACIERA
jgi:SAM-dependent methyltransferase